MEVGAIVPVIDVVANIAAAAAARRHAGRRARTSSGSRVAAENGDSGSILRATQRDHVLADMRSNKLSTLRIGMSEDVLNEVVAELITGNWR